MCTGTTRSRPGKHPGTYFDDMNGQYPHPKSKPEAFGWALKLSVSCSRRNGSAVHADQPETWSLLLVALMILLALFQGSKGSRLCEK